MSETYIQMFQEKFYPKIFLNVADKTIMFFENNEEQIVETAKKKFNQYLGKIVDMQKEQQIGPIAEITLSFLYTSLDERHVKFRMDCYQEGGRIYNESSLIDYLESDWLIFALDEMMTQFQECVKRESLNRYVRPAEFEVLKLRAVRSLLCYFASRFRYTIHEMLDLRKLAKVNKADSFVIQMGEYMDWQVPLFAILPIVDIFNCDKDTGLRFRHFPAIYYQKKEFRELILGMSKFEDCTFQQVVIDGCNMNDCIFDGCSFEEVTIQNTLLTASSFVNCTFKKVKFIDVIFGESAMERHEAEYFALPEFIRCSFQKSEFSCCKLPCCTVSNCEINGLRMESCDVEGAGFTDLEGIEWGE